MNRWVILTFRDDGTYGTTTYDDPNKALEAFELFKKSDCHLKHHSRYALILEGSELPIEGYVPGLMTANQKYK